MASRFLLHGDCVNLALLDTQPTSSAFFWVHGVGDTLLAGDSLKKADLLTSPAGDACFGIYYGEFLSGEERSDGVLRANLYAYPAPSAFLGIDDGDITDDGDGVERAGPLAALAPDTPNVTEFLDSPSDILGAAEDLNGGFHGNQMDDIPGTLINTKTATNTFLRVDLCQIVLDGDGPEGADFLATAEAEAPERAGLGSTSYVHGRAAIVDTLVDETLPCVSP